MEARRSAFKRGILCVNPEWALCGIEGISHVVVAVVVALYIGLGSPPVGGEGSQTGEGLPSEGSEGGVRDPAKY